MQQSSEAALDLPSRCVVITYTLQGLYVNEQWCTSRGLVVDSAFRPDEAAGERNYRLGVTGAAPSQS